MNASEWNELKNARAHVSLASMAMDQMEEDEFANLDHALSDLQKAFFALGRLKHARYGWVHLRPDHTIPESPHA